MDLRLPIPQRLSKIQISLPLLLIVLGLLLLCTLSATTLQSSLLEEKKNQIKQLVWVASSLAEDLIKQQQRGEISQTQAQTRALDAIKAMHYGNHDYFWVSDLNNRIIMHPIQPQLIGQDTSTLKDVTGKLFFQEIAALTSTQGEGFVEYLWPRPGSEQPEPKLTYVKQIDAWGWIIGTGIYIGDTRKQLWLAVLQFGGLALGIFILTALLTLTLMREMNRRRYDFELVSANNHILNTQLDIGKADLEASHKALKESYQQLEELASELERNERRFRGIADASEDAFVIFEAYRSLYANASAHQLFKRTALEGIALGEMLQLAPGAVTLEQLLHQPDYPVEVCALLHEERYELEISVVYYDLKAADKYALVLRDISARKQHQAQLLESNRQLELIIRQKQEMQEQLLQSEKLAAIGELAAGVAHEINNPVGFVGSNVGALKTYCNNLMDYSDQLNRYIRRDTAEFDEEQLNHWRKQYDIDYIRSDIEEVLHETTDGVRRIKQIVQDLKNFSRSSSGVWEPTQLNQEIESTLNLVWNELKYKCEVVKEYAELPEVECIRSEINQIIMNLLVNASHAITDQGTITIRTCRLEEQVTIAVSDTGQGIKPEHLDKIFNPFFTTKPVGKGTGLGLAVSNSIIEKHGGRIDVESTEGVGTTFTIVLPIHKPDRAKGA